MKKKMMMLVVGVVLFCSVTILAVNTETVPVGNPSNMGELSGSGAGGFGPDRICGAVEYKYNIGKYEVTAGQYTEFLNAVAADTDTYGLYNTNMWISEYGSKIERTDTGNGYTYSIAAEWANRPVNYVNWGDAARFANWMHNGQPTGLQGTDTTEDGSYFLNGVMSNAELLGIVRKLEATWVIPSEDEWYKAAYHKNDGITGNYWDYPTSTDIMPSNELLIPDGGNNANFPLIDYTIGSPYYRTEVGEFELSESPYGTFDMAGNVWEWNEAVVPGGEYRGLRAGAFNSAPHNLTASNRDRTNPTDHKYYIGFRVAYVPEPTTLSFIAIGALLLRKRHTKPANK